MESAIKAYLEVDDLPKVRELIIEDHNIKKEEFKRAKYIDTFGTKNIPSVFSKLTLEDIPKPPNYDTWVCPDNIALDVENVLKSYIAKYNYEPKKVKKARVYLDSTDWYITRLLETGKEVPADISDERILARETISTWIRGI